MYIEYIKEGLSFQDLIVFNATTLVDTYIEDDVWWTRFNFQHDAEHQWIEDWPHDDIELCSKLLAAFAFNKVQEEFKQRLHEVVKQYAGAFVKEEVAHGNQGNDSSTNDI